MRLPPRRLLCNSSRGDHVHFFKYQNTHSSEEPKNNVVVSHSVWGLGRPEPPPAERTRGGGLRARCPHCRRPLPRGAWMLPREAERQAQRQSFFLLPRDAALAPPHSWEGGPARRCRDLREPLFSAR